MTPRGKGSLSGLVRVRSVRERDSRIGLAAALVEENDAAALVAQFEQQLASVPAAAGTDLASFRGRQHRIELIALALTDARAGLGSAREITAAARDRWAADRTRLAAVESLVERRAAAVRAERRRRETRELDAVGEQLWRRSRTEEAS